METRAPSQRTTGRLALVVLVASLLGGGAIALVNPPFQGPDEGLHLYLAGRSRAAGWLLLHVVILLATPAPPLVGRHHLGVRRGERRLPSRDRGVAYLMRKPAGAPAVESDQSRYFLPILACTPLLAPG